MKRHEKSSNPSLATIFATNVFAMLASRSQLAGARSWRSLELAAFNGIRDADPVFGPSSVLLTERTSFPYELVEVEEMDPTMDYRTPSPSATDAPATNAHDGMAKSSSPSSVTDSMGAQSTRSPSATKSQSEMFAAPITQLPTPTLATENRISPISANPIGSPPNTKPPVVQMVGPYPPMTRSPETSFPTVERDTEKPTFSPSRHYEAANGNCPLGRGLHRLWLFDSAGDGWGSTELVIKEAAVAPSVPEKILFTGSLDADRGVVRYASGVSMEDSHVEGGGGSMTLDKSISGPDGMIAWDIGNEIEEIVFVESVYLCLEHAACYTAKVSGGTFLEETRWEITRVELGSGENVGLVAEGVGEGSGVCNFSLDGSCEKTCDGTFQVKGPTYNAIEPDPSASPSEAPTITINSLTHTPSTLHSKKPATDSPSDLLPQDKAFAFGIEEYERIRSTLLQATPNKEALAESSSPQSHAFEWIYRGGGGGLSDRRLVQRWALASFYYGANGDGWIFKDGWMSENNECGWYGVTCLHVNGLISKLELEQNRLVGELVPEISVWGELYVLSLGNDYESPPEEKNRFAMPLPLFLGSLTSLTFLNLENVGLTSAIPDGLFSSWTHLKSLYLNGNNLTGTLPKTKDLSSIETFWLGGNNLGGSINPEIGQLSTLRDLSLESNYRGDIMGKRGFIGTVPSEIGQLTNLEVLSLADNSLSGQVPTQMGDLISLRYLQLKDNFFEGQLPQALGHLEMLEELDISFNWLSSTIPPEFGNMISLTKLSLQSNYNDKSGYFTWGIKNKLPAELGKLKNIQHIDLSNNYLSGTLITEIGQLNLLCTLHLQNNFLKGPIPGEYSSCVSMKEILLQDNDVDTSSFGMPEEICRLPELSLARVDCGIPCNCCQTTC